MSRIPRHRTLQAVLRLQCPPRAATCALVVALLSCGTEPTRPGPVEAVQPVSSVRLDDAGNAGDASDLVVDFAAFFPQDGVQEYRAVLVDAASAPSFDLAAAGAVPADRYVVDPPGEVLHSLTFPATMTTVAGSPIVNGGSYVAFVMTIGSGGAVALSSASRSVDLAFTTVKITSLGNMGVLIEDEGAAVIIDGLSGNLAGWTQLSNNASAELTTGSAPPYDRVSVVMATHNHGDHYSPAAVQSFLQGNPGADFIGPPQVASSVSPSTRVVGVAPDPGQRESLVVNGVTIDVLHLSHFDQFGNDFSGVENYGFIVHLGGLKILHLGDVEYRTGNLSPFALDAEGIDIAIIPTFNTLLSAASAGVIEATVAPELVIATHFQEPLKVQEAAAAEALFGSVAFTSALQFFRY